MASTPRRSPDRLIDRLERDPRRFAFHEAVRLLERWGSRTHRAGQLGTQASPELEPVRFQADQSVGFPASEITSLLPRTTDRAGGEHPHAMRVSFIGLTGPLGVLPDFYTELIIKRQRMGDTALAAFLDVFLHRIVSLHYRAWKKYRLGPTIETSLRTRTSDAITTMTRSVIGFGLPSLERRLSVSDSVLLRYAGQLAADTRPASRLRRVLEDHFGIDVAVEEFRGTWRDLPTEDRSRLRTSMEPEGRYVTLGSTALLGRRVWDVLGSFRLRLGPLTRAQYDRLLPGRADARAIVDLTRVFVGPTLRFDAVLLIRRDRLPAARLGGPEFEGSHLGWNAWLGGGVGTDVAESAFGLEALQGRGTL